MKILFILLLLPSLAFADFEGEVVKVVDGDSLTVLTDEKRRVKVRLHGIDCPEIEQPYGDSAKRFTDDLIMGKRVRVIDHGKGHYGRTIGEVILSDGTNLSHVILGQGLAWWSFSYNRDQESGLLELAAKLERLGLWKDKRPLPPWVYRTLAKIM